MLADVLTIVRVSLFVAIPLIIVATAGLYSERSGVVNIALEGIMTFGIVFGALFSHYANEAGLTGFPLFLVGLVAAGIAGTLLSILHAFASVNMKANQVISGTALNIFAPAFGIFMARALFDGYGKIPLPQSAMFIRESGFLSQIPILGDILFTKTFPTILTGIVIFVVATVVMYTTKFGLRLRACGEHPQAADAAGINVARMRYAGVMISGLLAGMGGFMFQIPISRNYDPLFAAAGYGFLALAVLISGQWKPLRILAVGLLFGFVARLSSMNVLIPALNNLDLPTEVYYMIPYVATIIVLAFTSKNSMAPKAAGEPYDAGKR